MDAGLVNSLQRTSSIQGLLGQHLSSSQLSFSASVAVPPTERFCPGSLQDSASHRASQRGISMGLGHGSSLHYDALYSKWSLSGRKGFNGPAAVEGDGGMSHCIRTQVRRQLLIYLFLFPQRYNSKKKKKDFTFSFTIPCLSIYFKFKGC